MQAVSNTKSKEKLLPKPGDITTWLLRCRLDMVLSDRWSGTLLVFPEKGIKIDNALGSLCYLLGDEHGHAFRDEMTIV